MKTWPLGRTTKLYDYKKMSRLSVGLTGTICSERRLYQDLHAVKNISNVERFITFQSKNIKTNDIS